MKHIEREQLEKLLKETPREQRLKQIVLQDAIERHKGGYKNYLSDVIDHGCASGVVSDLVHYSDTHKFFDTHYDEIELIRHEHESNTGSPVNAIDQDLKNNLAWLAYEYAAMRICDELEDVQ